MYVYHKGDNVYAIQGDASLSFDSAAKPCKRKKRIAASASHCHKIYQPTRSRQNAVRKRYSLSMSK